MIRNDSVREEQAELQVALRVHETLRAMTLAEIRAPLSNIALAASAIERIGAGDPRVAEAARDIREHAARAAALVGDLADEGSTALDLRVNDLGGILDAAVQSAQPLALARGVRVEAHIGDGAARTLCDRLRAVRAMTSVLCVGLRRTPRGERLRVEGYADGSEVRVAFHDDGGALEDDDIESLLSPAVGGETWTPSRDLPRARQAITLMGGSLRVRRAPRGMIFEVTMPAPLAQRDSRP
jgi:nitrogen-specific signal transduction histidine kinase